MRWRLLERAGDPELAERVEALAREEEGGGAVLRCAACRREIVRREAAIERAGAHQHSFANPLGVRFRIGLFREAPGCRASGPLTLEYTWFPGYAWQIALCGGCQTHLGWRYARPGSPAFHGLILDRLLSGRIH